MEKRIGEEKSLEKKNTWRKKHLGEKKTWRKTQENYYFGITNRRGFRTIKGRLFSHKNCARKEDDDCPSEWRNVQNAPRPGDNANNPSKKTGEEKTWRKDLDKKKSLKGETK